MSVPDGFKVSEVGVIPEDWDVKKLGELVIKIVGGGTPSRNIKEYWNGKIYWATVKDLNSFNPCLTQETITKEGLNSSASNLIPKGNLIISTRMAVGKVVIYDVDVAINQDLKAICIKPDIDTQFLFFYFIELSNKIDFLTSGSTVKGIVLEDLKNLQIPLPSLPEQKAIAQSLSDVDTLITALDQVITKKRNIKQGTMQQLLTGKKRLPGFSDEWEVKKLGDLTTLVTNGFVGTATTQYTTSNDGILYIQGFNVIKNGFNLTGIKRVNLDFHLSHSKSCLKEGDLLTVQTGDIGTTTIVTKELEGSNCHALIITRFKKGKAEPHFFCQYFNSIYGQSKFKNIETGTTMKHINIGDFIEIILFIPPTIEEEKAISEILNDMDKEIEALEKKRDKYKAIKQGMMQELLTGKTRLISSS